MQKIILASQSKNRQAVLKALNIPFKVVVSQFDEQSVKETNIKLRAKMIALGKTRAVAKQHSGIIIAADTFTVLEGKIKEKPKNQKQATKMLNMLSSKQAISYTGFCFFNTKTKFIFNKTAKTKIWFRKLSKKEQIKYLKKYPVTTWAAAYALIDLYLFTLAKRLEGSLVGLTHGLPTEWLIPLLEKEGYHIRP